MDPFEQRLLRRLVFRPEAMSRNRNFEAFNDAALRRIRRQAKHLRSVIERLRVTSVEQVSLTETGTGEWTLRIEVPSERAVREVQLDAAALELLAAHPACAAIRLSRRAR
jgi:predicted PhzF superfamily epimerase YddE/YHI9